MVFFSPTHMCALKVIRKCNTPYIPSGHHQNTAFAEIVFSKTVLVCLTKRDIMLSIWKLPSIYSIYTEKSAYNPLHICQAHYAQHHHYITLSLKDSDATILWCAVRSANTHTLSILTHMVRAQGIASFEGARARIAIVCANASPAGVINDALKMHFSHMHISVIYIYLALCVEHS